LTNQIASYGCSGVRDTPPTGASFRFAGRIIAAPARGASTPGLPVIRQANFRGEADSRKQSLRNGSKNSQESDLLQFAGHFEESDFERVRF
jgi:hypothetical protein